MLTADGTITWRDSETGELYHNAAGAFIEAMENYVFPARLDELVQRRKGSADGTIRLFDGCFGLGYNTFALWQHVLSMVHLPIDRVEVFAVENDASIIQVLPDVLQQPCFKSLMENLRDQNDNSIVENLKAFIQLGLHTQLLTLNYKSKDGRQFKLNLTFADLRQAVPMSVTNVNENERFDLIFHDPFSPSKVPELWTVDLFGDYFTLLREDGGRLLTYSAASAVRGGLVSVGFKIYRTRGVGAKKGGTLAARAAGSALTDDLIFAIRPEEEERLKGASGIPYRDPGFNATRKDILRRRELEQKQFKQTRA